MEIIGYSINMAEPGREQVVPAPMVPLTSRGTLQRAKDAVSRLFGRGGNKVNELPHQAQLREEQQLENPLVQKPFRTPTQPNEGTRQAIAQMAAEQADNMQHPFDPKYLRGGSRGQVDKTSAILGGVAAAGLAAATVSGLGDPGIRPNEQPTPIVRSSDVPRNPLIATDPTLQARATAEKQFEEANLNPSTPEPLPTTPDQAAAQKYELDNNKPTEYLQHEYRSPLDGEPTPQDRPDGQSSNPAATPTPDQQPKVMTYKEAKATGIAPENSGAVIDTSE